jgi:hypothetical protein
MDILPIMLRSCGDVAINQLVPFELAVNLYTKKGFGNHSSEMWF